MSTTPLIRLGLTADLDSILALQRTESNRLGFLPRAALVEHVDKGMVFVAVDRGSRIIAYILGRRRSREQKWVRPITQLVVDRDERRRGIATLLVLHWTTEASRDGRDIVQAWTRIDLSAKMLWPALGFEPVGERRPVTARQIPAVLWRFPLTSEGHRKLRELPSRGGWRAEKVDVQQLLHFPPGT